jgi:tetratricopeptide (TPR) repeat protein/predicted aspartyl protease
LWLVTLFALTDIPAHATSQCKQRALDLPITMAGARPLFAAKINGEDATFVLDSGAFFSMISAAAAEQYKLKTEAPPFNLTVQGIGGTTTPKLTHVKSFGLGAFSKPNAEFLVGGSEVGSGSVGLLGQNFLSQWDVEYNLGQGNIRLMKNDDCGHSILAYWLTSGQPYNLISISMTSPAEPHTIGTAFVNGVKIKVLFDTGATTSVMSLKAAAHAGLTPEAPGVVDAGYASGIGRGMVKSYIAPVASLRFGEPGDQGEEIQRTRLRFADINIGDADMLIGVDFFLSHRILVANSQRRMYFTYNGGAVFNLSTSASQVGDQPIDAAAEPTDAAAFARRGAAYAGRRDFEHAIADLNRAIELDPKNAEFFYQRAMIYWAERQGAPARSDFDQALILQPDHIPALLSRARFKVAQNDFAGAGSDLEAVDRFAAKPSNDRLVVARLYDAMDDRSAAISQYDLWIQSHVDDNQLASALNGRCWDRALLGKDLSDALNDCNKAIKNSVKGANGAIYDSRALVHLRLGDYDASIADYDIALQLKPNEAASLYGRGIAKLRKNKRSEGEADIAAAVKSTPQIADRFGKFGIVP